MASAQHSQVLYNAAQAITGHLHYGGSAAKKSRRLGAKPKNGVTFRQQKRFETIARLENAGFGEGAVAAILIISVPRLRQIKKSPEYLAARIQITHGIIIDHESRMEQIKQQRREMLTQMLPPALQILANELVRPAITISERRHQAGLALELLDREGTFAKVSRTEIKPVDSFDFEQADQDSIHAIRALRGTIEAREGAPRGTREAEEASEEFASGATLTERDQQRALEKLEEEAASLRASGIEIVSRRETEE